MTLTVRPYIYGPSSINGDSACKVRRRVELYEVESEKKVPRGPFTITGLGIGSILTPHVRLNMRCMTLVTHLTRMKLMGYPKEPQPGFSSHMTASLCSSPHIGQGTSTKDNNPTSRGRLLDGSGCSAANVTRERRSSYRTENPERNWAMVPC